MREDRDGLRASSGIVQFTQANPFSCTCYSSKDADYGHGTIRHVYTRGNIHGHACMNEGILILILHNARL